MSSDAPPLLFVPPDTHPDDLEVILTRLAGKKEEWARASMAARVELLRKILEGTLLVSERWVEASARAKGLDPADLRAGEEWLSGPMPFVQNVRMMIDALAAGGAPKPARLRARPDGRHVARVFPLDMLHRIIVAGTTAELWTRPGMPPTQGTAIKSPPTGGHLGVVLGAGNISAIPAMDALYKLFAEGQVVVLKMNPLNAAVGPLLETAFRSVIDAGYFAIVYGDARVGEVLVSHPRVDAIHMTGSDATYEAIVFGRDPAERARRKAESAAQNTRPFSAELGCVTPVVLAPGPYSRRDLEYQARHVAAMLTHNGGFNCDSAQVLVLSHEWLQKRTFLELLRQELAQTPPRPCFTPGAADRRAAIVARHPKAESFGEGAPDKLPWTLVTGLFDSAPADEMLFTKEAFCGALSVVELTATRDPSEFLARAVAFANERLWGTLSICLILHPAVLDEHEAAVDRAIADLGYGAIGINAWPGMIFAMAGASWGAFPGHSAIDIQSGTGVVHNALLFDHPEKTVVRAPFRMRPPPPYFANLEGVAALGRALTLFEAAPSLGGAVAVARAGLGLKMPRRPRPRVGAAETKAAP